MLLLAFLLAAVPSPADLASSPNGRTPRLNPEAPTTAFINGLWYDSDASGIRFKSGDRFSIAGVFTAQRPEEVDRTIDLGGKFVIPPFGEAHNHSVDGAWTLPTAERYLRQGIFYYKNPNDIATSTESGRPSFNKPDRLDVVWSHGGLSIAGGHPEGLYRGLASNLGLDPDKLDGKAFFHVPTPASVARRWPEILGGRPDFIKLYLLDAEGRGRMKPSGLSPAALRQAVVLARESGLTTTVHVETSADLELAADSGADEAAHLPGYGWADGLEAGAYRISGDLARKLARRKFIVVTTTVVTEGGPPTTPGAAARRKEIQALQVENLRRLHEAGVPLAIGCDSYSKTALDESNHLRKLGAFSDADLLRLWVETGPLSIFPRRSIGVLAPGYEASFLVLEGDPTRDFSQVERIQIRVKQGIVLDKL